MKPKVMVLKVLVLFEAAHRSLMDLLMFFMGSLQFLDLPGVGP